MLKSSRARMVVAAALVAAAVGPLGAAAASAQAATVVDDTAADFSLGTPSDTVVRTLTTPDGAVELSRTLEEQFTVAPAGWMSTTWAALPVTTTSTVLNGALVIDGQRADSGVAAGPGSSLEFKATFGTQPYNHVGFATDFALEPWAMFSTGPDGGGKVYARTSDGAGPLADIDFPIPGVVATDPHTYRIDWTAAGFAYYVDAAPVPVPVVTHAIPLTAAMRPQASDFDAGNGGVSVDSMILNTHKATGKFISRILDGGGPQVTGLSFKPTSEAPSGTTIGYETRTAANKDDLNTPADVPTAPWVPLGAGNTVTSPAKQFVQYRTTMTTTPLTTTATPRLDKVEVGFTLDTQAPVVTIDDVAVSGATAKVRFHSDDATAVNKCKLDGAAFTSCASPEEFSGLADGSHTIVVQATDAIGNAGIATRTFDVVPTTPPPSGGGTTPPPSGGGTTPPPSGGGTTPLPSGGSTLSDRTAPKVLITQRSVRVSTRGVASIRVKCPLTEVRCTVVVKLKLGGKTVARKTLTLGGGTTRALDLRLSKSARSALAARSKVTVTAIVTATDAAANHKTTQVRMTLRAPSH